MNLLKVEKRGGEIERVRKRKIGGRRQAGREGGREGGRENTGKSKRRREKKRRKKRVEMEKK